MPRLAGRVFLSYRREESRHLAGRLADRINGEFSDVQVFMDVDTIAPGEDFSQAISQAVSRCDLLLALIGPNWLGVSDPGGRRRLSNAHDWVRREIGTALSRGIKVIPVLIDEARMPQVEDLPGELSSLASRNALRIDHETFSTDISRLLDSIRNTLTQAPKAGGHRAGHTRAMTLAAARSKRTVGDNGNAPQSSPGVVPIHRAALRIALWILAFPLTFFSAVGLGVTIGGKVTGGTSSTIIALVLYGLLSLSVIGCLMLWIRKETRRQRALITSARDAGAPVKLSFSLSVTGIRLLSGSLVSIFLAFVLLAWLT